MILDQFCNPVTVDYNGFNITWNETQSGIIVEAPCTGDRLNGLYIYINEIIVILSSVHDTGTIRRRCVIDDTWEEFFECFREENRRLLDQVIIYKYLVSLN